jgi:hypothetical protein
MASKGNSVSLSQYVEELGYAAGPGAGHIASSLTASGNIQARIGVPTTVPGVGLRSVLARAKQQSTRVSDTASSTNVLKIADRMARSALKQGAKLLSGRQT